jgi:hypothetical protein
LRCGDRPSLAPSNGTARCTRVSRCWAANGSISSIGRLKEELSLPQRLYASRSAEEWRQANVEFWQQAVDDYQKELAVMTRLASGFVNNSLAAAQSRVDEAAREIGRSYAKAA